MRLMARWVIFNSPSTPHLLPSTPRESRVIMATLHIEYNSGLAMLANTKNSLDTDRDTPACNGAGV